MAIIHIHQSVINKKLHNFHTIHFFKNLSKEWEILTDKDKYNEGISSLSQSNENFIIRRGGRIRRRIKLSEQ
jgi:hypothetical protein